MRQRRNHRRRGASRFRAISLAVLVVGALTALASPAYAAVTAEITSPVAGEYRDGVVSIMGTATAAPLSDFDSYIVQITFGTSVTFTFTLVVSAAPVVNGVLATWDTSRFEEEKAVVRLIVRDAAVKPTVVEVPFFLDHTPATLSSVGVAPDPHVPDSALLSVEASEVLSSVPAVVIDPAGPSPSQPTFVSASGSTYVFRHPISAGTPPGYLPVAVTLTDRAGHVATTTINVFRAAAGAVNVALGATTTESSPGWGGGALPQDMVDGLTSYVDTWAHGLAFTGGPKGWGGQACGFRQAVVDFGEAKVINGARVWHHGPYAEHIPSTYALDTWNGSAWVAAGGTSQLRPDLDTLLTHADRWGSTPTEHLFPTTTASKVRFSYDNCQLTTGDGHGWIYEFEVFAPAVAGTLTSIAVSPANTALPKGSTQQYRAVGTFTDGSTQDITGSVSWTSSGPSVAPVDGVGLVTASAVGTTALAATSGAVSRSTAFTVTPATITSIAVSPGQATLPKGATQQYRAVGTYTDGTTQDITASATWTSSNTRVATIAAGGLAQAVAIGDTTILAFGGRTWGSATLKVGAAALASVVVSPANPSVPIGTNQSFTAVGTYTDGATKTLTGSATWASSNGAVATVSPAGVATTKSVGTTAVAATSGSVSGSSTLSVTRAPTWLVATARSVSSPMGTTVTFTLTLRQTTGGQGIPNRVVTVSAPGARTCTATTKANGSATCSVQYPRSAIPPQYGRFTATFAGDASYLPTSSSSVIP